MQLVSETNYHLMGVRDILLAQDTVLALVAGALAGRELTEEQREALQEFVDERTANDDSAADGADAESDGPAEAAVEEE